MPEQTFELSLPWGTLSGTLLLPEGSGPCTAALLIAGSGPTDRDGNNLLVPVPIDNLKLLAQALAARGIASLRYDKRGVGASAFPGLKEEELRFDHMVDDAVACAAELRQDARFDRLLLVGHSEGGLVALLAAPHAQAGAVVSISAAGMPAGELMRIQVARGLPAEQAERAIEGLRSLEAQQPVEQVPDEFFLLFRTTVQPYLMSWFRHDPARLLAGLTVPVLLVHGAADAQVPAEHARLLHAARADARLCIVDGMDHAMAVEGDYTRGVAVAAEEIGALLAQAAVARSA